MMFVVSQEVGRADEVIYRETTFYVFMLKIANWNACAGSTAVKQMG